MMASHLSRVSPAVGIGCVLLMWRSITLLLYVMTYVCLWQDQCAPGHADLTACATWLASLASSRQCCKCRSPS